MAEVTPIEIKGGVLPSNGSEGEDFRYVYCDRCHHDINEDCPIYLEGITAYPGPGPEQWQRRLGPQFCTVHCTAFQPRQEAN